MTNAPSSRTGWGIIVLQATALVLVGMWAFFPARHGAWLWDDDQYITQNALLRTPPGLSSIWFAPAGVNYFPLTATVQWVEWHLWGDATAGYHAVNLGLHLLSALLLWRLLQKLGAPLAFWGGLIFAVHPLTVESVAWISELKNTLSLPLMLLALLAMVDYAARPSRGAYLRSLIYFLAALLAKSTVALFPLVILLYYWWQRRRVGLRGLGALIPFFALSLGLGSLTWWFEHARAIGQEAVPLEGLFSRTVAAGLAVVFYLAKCLWPTGLMPIYPRWPVDPPTLLQLAPWPLIALCAGLLWGKCETWGRPILFGLGCFLASVLPVLGFVPMAYLRLAWAADHFAYLALVPVVALAVAGCARLEQLGALGRWPRFGVRGGLIVAAAVLALASRRYSAAFQSPEALWTAAVRANPRAWSAHNDLGTIRYDAGRVPEAIAEFADAVRLNPAYAEARNNLGVALASDGRRPEAILQYQEVLRLKPGYANAWCNLGTALLQSGRLTEAVTRYREALRIKADFPEAHYNLGLALRALGQNEAAEAEFGRSGLPSPR